MNLVQGVPHATEPGISLIILTPTKILQPNLNRSRFIVWEMKRDMSVVRLIVATRSSCPPASQSVSCLTRLSADLCHLAEGAWLFLMEISERGNLPKQTTNHRRLESKHHRRNSGSDSGRTGKDVPKYGAPDSILSGRKWWPLPAHVMMSSHFSHNERTPAQISLQYRHWC